MRVLGEASSAAQFMIGGTSGWKGPLVWSRLSPSESVWTDGRGPRRARGSASPPGLVSPPWLCVSPLDQASANLEASKMRTRDRAPPAQPSGAGAQSWAPRGTTPAAQRAAPPVRAPGRAEAAWASPTSTGSYQRVTGQLPLGGLLTLRT